MSARPSNDTLDESIIPYNIHVSSRYLDLTRNKLQLTRLPHLPPLSDIRHREYGATKAEIEALIDVWLESYDWRAREQHYNALLPQYRTLILPPSSAPSQPEKRTPLRIHFVHRPSVCSNAIPLLYCHDWPGGIFEISKIIDQLTNPPGGCHAGHHKRRRAFHLVCPSWPGCGFSEMWNAEPTMGPKEVAGVLDGLMTRLGYSSFVPIGTGRGFTICRMLALHYPSRCLGIYTTTPISQIRPLSLTHRPRMFFRYQLSRLSRTRLFKDGVLTKAGTSGEELQKHRKSFKWPWQFSSRSDPSIPPHTLAYSLCDSPVGLLSYVFEALRERTGVGTDDLYFKSVNTVAQGGEEESRTKPFNSTEILDFTMLSWLPGPEAPLRYLYDSSRKLTDMEDARKRWSDVPLGISVFASSRGMDDEANGNESSVHWARCIHPVRWTRRHHAGDEDETQWPIWQRSDDVAGDLSDFVDAVEKESKAPKRRRFLTKQRPVVRHEQAIEAREERSPRRSESSFDLEAVD